MLQELPALLKSFEINPTYELLKSIQEAAESCLINSAGHSMIEGTSALKNFGYPVEILHFHKSQEKVMTCACIITKVGNIKYSRVYHNTP